MAERPRPEEMTDPPSDDTPSTRMSSVANVDFDDILKEIAKSLYKNSDIDDLGKALGFGLGEIGRKIAENANQGGNHMGTLDLLRMWRNRQTPSTEKAALRSALLEAGFDNLVDQYLSTPVPGAPVTMPGSQTQPLSPHLIKRCADDFKFKYRTTLCKIRADPLDPDSIVPFDDMYTNLVLEEEYRKRKRPLEYKNIFDLKVNREFPKRIMVQGEAGAGKTTFCAKIAWDWINESPDVPKFVWVLVVPFREAKQYTIGEIAKSYLSKDNPTTACQITEYMRSNPKDVFIAFDGLDEFDGNIVEQRKAGSKSECHQPKSADQTMTRSTSATSQPRVNTAEASGSSSERGDIAIKDILRSDELATCPMLVTSRPWKVTGIRWDDSLRKQYTFMHLKGFSKENVAVYIHKYFEDDGATADQLIQLTIYNDIIFENMAPYPIYIAMLCLMWRELSDEKREKFKSFQTFSQIFDEMFEFLKVHYAQKMITDLGSTSFKAYLSQIEKLMEPVAKVAFIGLKEKTLIFKEDDFEQCSDSMEIACKVGVLSQEKKMSSLYDKSGLYLKSTVFFPHKLFQEYMAGVHLASLYESDHNEFNRLIEQVVLPRKEEFRYLLYFTVSRDKTIANHVMKCMVQGSTTSKEEMNFLVDVSFESQDLDTAALVRGRVLSLTISSIMTAHTIAGYVFTGLYKHVTSFYVTNREFGPTTSHDVAEIICSAPSLDSVLLSIAVFHGNFYVVLAKEGNKSKVKTLELFKVRCPTSASSHHLVEALCSMPNLTDLALYGEDFQKEFYSTLHAKASALQVQTLELMHMRCPTPASSHHLVETLCSMPNLTHLKLFGQDFQEEFYSSLNAKASTLQFQDLLSEDVQCTTQSSIQNLAESLCSMPKLTDLTFGSPYVIGLCGSQVEAYVSSIQAKGRTFRVHHLSLYDDKELDDATKKLREEGCAPKTPSTSNKEDEEELVLPIKGNEIPAKKKKKSKKEEKEKKKKMAHDGGDSESNPVVKTKKKEDEDYRGKKEQTKQEDDSRMVDGSGRKESGKSKRRYNDDKARSSYHSTRCEDDKTKVKRREDEQKDRNYRWDRERKHKPRMDKRERERGRRDLDGETESERRGDREERRNDRSGEIEDKRDRRDREKERDKRERERQRDSRDRHGERERDGRDRESEKDRERQGNSRDRNGARERERDRRDREREKERERRRNSRDRDGERERDRRDRDRDRYR